MNARTHSHRLAVEFLEDRWTPAGDVTGVVVDGTLFLTGDFNHNRIMITMSGGIGTYTVEGVFQEAFGDTTINGLLEDTFSGVTNIVTKMNEGKDYVFVNGDTGQGAPGPFILLGDLKITTQTGEDNIVVENATIHGQTTINSGADADHAQIIDSLLKRDLSVKAGNGGDLLGIFRSTVEGATSVLMADGFDTVLFGGESFSLDGGTFKGATSVDLGLGENSFESNVSTFEGTLGVVGGDGADIFRLIDSTMKGRVDLSGSTGGDRFTLTDSTFEDVLSIGCGRGRDIVEAFDSTFMDLADFRGGLGFDTLDAGLVVPDNGNVFLGSVVRSEFEVET
jgi:hypothetical protein